MIEKTTTLHIRVPESLVKQIKAAAKESGSPMGIALKYLIEQDITEVIESRITNLEENLKNWINTQVDMSTSLALLNFRVAFLQDMFRVRFPLELTEEQKEKVWAGESGEAIKFILDGMRAQKKHYEDTKQKRHPSYKACLDALKQYQEIMQVSDNHIT